MASLTSSGGEPSAGEVIRLRLGEALLGDGLTEPAVLGLGLFGDG